jgi:chemotaxis protein MotC
VRIGPIIVAVFCVLLGADVSFAKRVQLRDTIRTLESVQDKTAFGDQGAADLQSKLIIQIEADINNATVAELQDERNLKAIAVYLFSGGGPDVVERRLTSLTVAPEMKTILDGALAYARADKANANKYLGDVHPEDLPANLGGRVALVKAILIADEDPTRALNLLATARVMMPGTLVEEAALRRCISFAARLSDVRHVEQCGSHYIRRFSTSVYRQEFNDSLALALIQVDYLGATGTLEALSNMLNDLSPVERRTMLLVIARAAIGRGKLVLASACAGKTLEIPQAGHLETARANLYLGAAMIVQNELDAGKEKFTSVDKGLLDASDAALFKKVLDLAAQISERPKLSGDEMIPAPATAEQEPTAFTNVVARAERALADKPAAQSN